VLGLDGEQTSTLVLVHLGHHLLGHLGDDDRLVLGGEHLLGGNGLDSVLVAIRGRRKGTTRSAGASTRREREEKRKDALVDVPLTVDGFSRLDVLVRLDDLLDDGLGNLRADLGRVGL
jgi:hypothetical protein